MRRAAPFSGLPRSALEAVLDMLAGRYPSDAFAELRPRLVWDRVSGELTARRGAQHLAVTSGGTIPDRGLFGVFLASGEGPGRRVGELDEEMVYESRVGDVFLLGSSSWRIEDITHDRVLVTPAPGELGKMPFWKGDSARPAGRAGPRARGVPARGGRGLAGGRRRPGPRRRPGRLGHVQPADLPDRAARGDRPRCPTTARSWSSGSATSSATGGWSSTPRSAPRSTPRGRWPSPPGCVSATASRCPRCTPTTASCCGCPTPTPSRPTGEIAVFEPDEIEALVTARGRRLGAVRVPVPRVRRPVAAAAPARPAPPHAAVAAAPARQPAAAGGERVRRLPGRARGDARVPAGRVRRARAGRADARPVRRAR